MTVVPWFGAASSFSVGGLAELNGTKVVATMTTTESGSALFVLSPGAPAWTQRSFPTGGLSSFQALDGLILVVDADQRDASHMTIGLLDPERLPIVVQPNDSDGTSK